MQKKKDRSQSTNADEKTRVAVDIRSPFRSARLPVPRSLCHAKLGSRELLCNVQE